MKKAAIYPFDKITRGLVKFREELDFEISTVIDFVFNIGEDAGEATEGRYAGIPITNDAKEALEEVDTLIINSMNGPFYNENYIRIYREYEVEKKCRDMILNASEKGIEIICTHDINDALLKEWLQENKVELTTYGKSDEEIEEFIKAESRTDNKGKAIRVAIYATGCCVGKYTAQIHLLKAMKEKKMKTGALITEPVAKLYNQYDADPVRLGMLKNPMRYVYYVEALAKRAQRDGNDYIIMADQQSITSQYYIEEVAANTSLLKAYKPDTILLVAGYEDDSGIQDCLDIFRIYCDGKRPAAILIPDRIEVSYGEYEIKTKEEINLRKKALKDKFKIENIEVVGDVGNIISKITG